MLASHPDYEGIRNLTALLATAMNPILCGPSVDMDMAEPERHALVVTLKDALADLLEGGAFADWLNSRDV